MTAADVRPGDVVRLVNTGNPFREGLRAVILSVEEWGAHTAVEHPPLANADRYRAAWEEMGPDDPPPADPGPKGRRRTVRATLAAFAPRDAGYTGDECGQCGSMRMRRNGACLLCDSCGATSGCS